MVLLSLCSTLPAYAVEELAAGEAATLLTLNDSYVNGLSEVTAFTWLPDGRMVIVQKTGEIKVRTTAGTVVDAGSFSVDTESEKGLLNVLPHPDFETNQLLFFFYSQSNQHRIVTAPIGLDNQVDTGQEDVLLENLPAPENHDGGGLALSPDGQYLYVSVGDTGCNNEGAPGTSVNFFGTCLNNPNGKVLRITVSGEIPQTNPLVALGTVTACGPRPNQDYECTTSISGTGAPSTAIWAWGFRNPFRISTDPVTGNVWVGDVGEATYEEVNVVAPAGGKHYGWPYREGGAGQAASMCATITPNVGDCTPPAYFCKHGAAGTENGQPVDGQCQSIAGGVITDCSWPEAFRDRYVFGDTEDGLLWALELTADRSGVVPGSRKAIVSGSTERVVYIATGPDKALYYAALGGHITRIAPNQLGECPAMPDAGVGGSGGAGGGGGVAGSGGSGVVAGGAAGTGSGGVVGTGGSSGGQGGATTGGGTPMNSNETGGCGCRVGSASSGALAASALLVAGLAAGLRRRRSRR